MSNFRHAISELVEFTRSTAPWVNPGLVYRVFAQYSKLLKDVPHTVAVASYDGDGDLTMKVGAGCPNHEIPENGPARTVVLYIYGTPEGLTFAYGWVHPDQVEETWH